MMTKTKWLKTPAMTLAGLASLTFTAPRAEGSHAGRARVERLERSGELPQQAVLRHLELAKAARSDRGATSTNLPFGIKLGGGIATLVPCTTSQRPGPTSRRLLTARFDREQQQLRRSTSSSSRSRAHTG